MAKRPPTIEVVEPRVEQLFDLLPYQRVDVEAQERFRWSCWSRQTGKSFSKSLRRIIRGLACGRNQLFLSAGERQSRELMMKAQDHLRKLKRGFEIAERVEVFEDTKFNAMEIIVQGGIRIIGLPANPLTARGFTGDVFLDEFAMHGQKDKDIYASAFGAVTRNAGELDVCSTPKGRLNMFYRLRENKVFSHDTLTIYDAVNQGCPANPEELRAGIYDDILWRQEFLCEFVDEATAFLTYELICKCEDPNLVRAFDLDALREMTDDVYVGMDIGRERNPTVIWLFKLVGSLLVHIGIIELVGMPFREQFSILSDILRCKCVRRCCIDASGLGSQMGEDAARDFGSKVEAIKFTLPVKEQLAGDLLIKIQDALVRLPVCERIRNDLHSIQRSVTQAGHARYQAPNTDDEHADRFWALALAVHAAGKPSGKIEIELGPPRGPMSAYMQSYRRENGGSLFGDPWT